jgi:hypothetical protein
MADLAFSLDTQISIEKVVLNYGESEYRDLELFSTKWRHVRISLNMDDLSGTVAIDGRTVLERVPLFLAPLKGQRPEIAFYRGNQTTIDVWIDDFEVEFQDRTVVALREEDISIKPIFRDDFDRYSTALAPIQGGWLLVQDSALNIHDDISRYAQPTSVSVAGLFSRHHEDYSLAYPKRQGFKRKAKLGDQQSPPIHLLAGRSDKSRKSMRLSISRPASPLG